MKCLCLRTQLSKNKKGPGPSHTNEISLFLSNRKTFYVDHFYFYNFNCVCACVIYLFIVGPKLGKRRRVAIWQLQPILFFKSLILWLELTVLSLLLLLLLEDTWTLRGHFEDGKCLCVLGQCLICVNMLLYCTLFIIFQLP